MKRQIILASQSPRRQELLQKMGLTFMVVPSQFDEHLDDSRTPQEVACELALGKAQEVAARYPEAVVIGADTIVTVDGTQLEKPKDSQDAHQMLKRLSGTHNEATTGIAIVCVADRIEIVAADTTKVFFKPYDQAVVEAYVATGDPLDKAGAYGIQSGGAELMSHIQGHFDTVVGLPTTLLAELLSHIGVAAHPVAYTSPVEQR